MQVKLLVLASLTSTIVAQEAAALTGLYGDISGHISEYLSYVQDGNSLPNGLLNLYQEVQTYTDDSYTTLLSSVDFGQISSFVTGLPWYSSRLETIFAEATGGSDGSSGSGSGSGSQTASGSGSASSLDSSLVGGSSAASIISSITSSASGARSSSGGGAAGGSGSQSGSQSGSGSSRSGSSSGSGSGSESESESSSGSGSGSGSGSSSGSGSGSSSSEGGSSGSGAGLALREQSSQVVYFLIPFMMVLAAPALL